LTKKINKMYALVIIPGMRIAIRLQDWTDSLQVYNFPKTMCLIVCLGIDIFYQEIHPR